MTVEVTHSDTGGVAFENVAASSGLRFRWPMQKRPIRSLESFGVGCAFLDYDGDGWQDILLIGKPSVALFRNLKNGRFEDVGASSGLNTQRGDWKGCAVGDYDNDGRLDLLLTGYRALRLLKSDNSGRWIDQTRAAGLDPTNRGHWGSSAGFMDLDGNGTLDLVIGNYVVFGPKETQFCELIPGVISGCPPAKYRPEFAEMWRNEGGGRFKDVTAISGLKDTHGKALVVAFSDVDNDGRIDFYIGNDGVPAELMHNQGKGRFINIGRRSSAAYGSMPGQPIAAMGADWGDYDRDGRLDLVVTAFSDEPYSLLRNRGDNLFEHQGDQMGITGPTLKPLGFGDKWLDFDNDGWLDIVFTNGHVYDRADELDPLSPWRQPLMLFHNRSAAKKKVRHFVDVASKLGADVAKPIVGRGLATGDFDNDGRVDILAVDYEGAPMLLHNRSQTPNHWLKIELRGVQDNRFAYGARVDARAGGQRWTKEVSPASSYLSSSDPRLHLGLGTTEKLDSISIRWPSGQRQTLRRVGVDRTIVVQQGRGIIAQKTADTAASTP